MTEANEIKSKTAEAQAAAASQVQEQQAQQQIDMEALHGLFAKDIQNRNTLREVNLFKKQNNLTNDQLAGFYKDYQQQNFQQQVPKMVESGQLKGQLPPSYQQMLTPQQLSLLEQAREVSKRNIQTVTQNLPEAESKDIAIADTVNKEAVSAIIGDINEDLNFASISEKLGFTSSTNQELVSNLLQEKRVEQNRQQIQEITQEIGDAIAELRSIDRTLQVRNPRMSAATRDRLSASSKRALELKVGRLESSLQALNTANSLALQEIQLEAQAQQFDSSITLQQRDTALRTYQFNKNLVENRDIAIKTHQRNLETLDRQHAQALKQLDLQHRQAMGRDAATYAREAAFRGAQQAQIEAQTKQIYSNINLAEMERQAQLDALQTQGRNQFTPQSLLGGPRTEVTANLGQWFDTWNIGGLKLWDKYVDAVDAYLKQAGLGSAEKDEKWNIIFRNAQGEVDLSIGIDGMAAFLDVKGYKTAESGAKGIIEAITGKKGIATEVKAKNLLKSIWINWNANIEGLNGADIKQKIALEAIKMLNSEAYGFLQKHELVGDGYLQVKAQDGRISFQDSASQAARASNLNLEDFVKTYWEDALMKGYNAWFQGADLAYFARFNSLETPADLERFRGLIDNFRGLEIEDENRQYLNNAIGALKEGWPDAVSRSRSQIFQFIEAERLAWAASDRSVTDLSVQGYKSLYQTFDDVFETILLLEESGYWNRFGAIGGSIEKVRKSLFESKGVSNTFRALELGLESAISSGEPVKFSSVDGFWEFFSSVDDAARDLTSKWIPVWGSEWNSMMRQILSKPVHDTSDFETLNLLLDGAIISLIRQIRVESAGSAVTGPELSSLRELINATRRDSVSELLGNLGNLRDVYTKSFNDLLASVGLSEVINPSNLKSDVHLVSSFMGYKDHSIEQENFFRTYDPAEYARLSQNYTMWGVDLSWRTNFEQSIAQGGRLEAMYATATEAQRKQIEDEIKRGYSSLIWGPWAIATIQRMRDVADTTKFWLLWIDSFKKRIVWTLTEKDWVEVETPGSTPGGLYWKVARFELERDAARNAYNKIRKQIEEEDESIRKHYSDNSIIMQSWFVDRQALLEQLENIFNIK